MSSKELKIGEIGELLVEFRLAQMGISVTRCSQSFPYDLFADVNGHPIKIQVKTSSEPRLHDKRHVTKKYNYRILKGASNKIKYSKEEFDVLALVALDKERVLFKVWDGERYCFGFHPEDFTKEDEEHTWTTCLKKLKQGGKLK